MALNNVVGGCANAITLRPCVIMKARVTGGAAATVALPGWFAVIEHVPAATNVVAPDATVQTLVEVDV